MRRVLPNILLLLLLLFLLPVYQANPTPQVLGLGVLLLAAAFFLAYTNQPRGLEILTGLTAIISFVGVAFWGRLVAGPNGAYCFVGLWILALIGLMALFYQRAVFVERGQILVLNQLPENRALVWTEGLHRPLRPFVERRMAALPAYELDQEVEIHNLNTRSLYNVNQVTVLVRYRVAQPRDVVFCFPNREQAYEELARERGKPRDKDTDEQVAFWTELIRRQMLLEIEQNVRTVIAYVGGPTDVSTDRESHAQNIRGRMQSSVARWGMEILDLRLLEVIIDPERIKMLNRDRIIEREKADAQRKAQLRAEEVRLLGEAQAEATARMVSEMVKTLQQQGTSLTTEEIERIVITAMQRMSDQQQLSGFFRDVAQTGAGLPATGQTTSLNPNQGTRG
jgi:regulator of protease activity HflC (stomatin/prohibitin superfamily)